MSGCRKRSAAKGVRSLFPVLVTFWSLFSEASATFFRNFLRALFAGLLLWQRDYAYVFALNSNSSTKIFFMYV